MQLLLANLTLIATAVTAFGADSLPRLDATPESVEQLWAGYDPRSETLDTEVVRTWKEDGLVLRYVVYSIGAFKDTKARMAALYGFPEGGKNLPALMHMHGGGPSDRKTPRAVAKCRSCSISAGRAANQCQNNRPPSSTTTTIT